MHSLPIETKRERKNSVIAIVHWRSLATRRSTIIETLIDFESGLRNFRGIPFLQLVTKSGRKENVIEIVHWRSLDTRCSTKFELMIDFDFSFEEWT
ncbi:hypothetical protein V1478_002271 [Vespula squamosa]|uniref:Uncharacterized protein n=1 Tax=Vespula squamosa TaxID=30214 RepID=A0ABD2BWI1_VESSQ